MAPTIIFAAIISRNCSITRRKPGGEHEFASESLSFRDNSLSLRRRSNEFPPLRERERERETVLSRGRNACYFILCYC